MEWNQQTLAFLSQCFLDTLSSEPELRRNAVRNLSDAADKPNYGLAVLRLVTEPTVDKRIRELASVNFKNYGKARWKPYSSGSCISDNEKKQIKELIVSPLCVENWESSPVMQSEVKEAILIISNLDYKLSIPQLKSSLKKAIKVNDYASVNEILTTLDLLFDKFLYHDTSDRITSFLRNCLDNFSALLLTTVKSVSVKISAASARSNPTLLQIIETQKFCCKIFFSLNAMGLSDIFVYNVDKWMNEFKKYLTVRYPFVEDSRADGVALVDEVRVVVLGNISLYMNKNEKVFQKYVGGFVEVVLSLLVEASACPNRVRLNMLGIMFLSFVSRSIHHAVFAGDDILQQIIQSIVIPNVMIRNENKEQFEMNYVEFIRRDMETGDVATKRRLACELVVLIADNYKEKVTQKVSEQIHNCLTLFAENPSANWKYIDCAVYLIVSLASVSADLVDVDNFFLSFIVPELQCQDVNAIPMSKACALKFFIFWVQISKPTDMALLGDVIRFLCSNVNVVHSYAAICLEKLLLSKDDDGQARFTSVNICPILPGIMTNLFRALEKPKSEGNKYIMRCIMRVIQIADISPEVASTCITRLITVLNRVCENPKILLFSHCLFESIAILVKRTCEKNPSLLPTFESSIFPSIQMIQANEVLEFFPYIFQLYTQLFDFNQPPFSQQYMSLFDMILKLDFCNTSASAYLPALIHFLRSFIKRVPDELNREGRLRRVLEIFNELVSSRSKEVHGFNMLLPLIENLEYDGLAELMNYIWPSVFTSLQKSKSPMLFKCLIIFLSLFLVKHDIQTLVDSINSVQANLFRVILGEFWIPNLETLTGSTDVNLCAIAASKLLCESPLLLNPAAEEIWGKLLNGIVALLSQPEEKRVEDEPAVLYIGGETRYRATLIPISSVGKKDLNPFKEIDNPRHYLAETEVFYFKEETGNRATFVPLLSVCKYSEDPLQEIKNPKYYLVDLLANLSFRFPGRFPLVITRYLSSANQATLLQLCNSYNVTIV